jgi:glycosyltransferase involved in cell wall biosynthesis
MRPVVVGIVPAHNHAKWVGDAIRALAEQTYPVGHIVVVDDGSTDGTADAVIGLMTESLEEVDHWQGRKLVRGHLGGTDISLLMGPHPVGPAAARNAAFRFVWNGATHFAMCDSDDFYHPDKVRISMECFKDPAVGMVYTDYETLRESDGLRVREYKRPFDRDYMLASGECLPNCDSVVSIDALAKAGVFDESLRTCEDLDLWFRLSAHHVIWHEPTNLLTIRVGDHSSTSRVPQETWSACYQKVMERARQC